MKITAADVLAARRHLARDDLKWFARMVDIPTVPVSTRDDEDVFETLRIDALALHHDALLGALAEVAAGRIKNLMVLMPPGSAKSTYVDVVFIPWFLATRPRSNVILASYGADLVRKQGRRARQLVKSRSFNSLFPDVALSAESSAADEWALTNGSEFMAGGVLSGITGNRADLLVIDDPVKGREEAESEVIRKKTREAYEDDLQTRLKPGGRRVIIQTRWHEDDLAGSILPENWDGESGDLTGRDGEAWRVLSIPAKAERLDDPLGRKPGEYLWPEWFGPDHWGKFERNARTWSSLFQQKPAPEEGTFFQRGWFKRHAPFVGPPKNMRLYGWSDYAVTDQGGDYTEHGIFGVDSDSRIYQIDWWHGQTTSDQWIEAQIDMIALYHPACWFGEGGVIQKAIEPMLWRRMRERQVRCRLEWVSSIHDKATRARGFQSRAAMGEVSLLSDERGDRVLDQLLKFPAGKHDDAVDVCGGMGRVLDMAHPALVEAPKQEADPFEYVPPTFDQMMKRSAARSRQAGVL